MPKTTTGATRGPSLYGRLSRAFRDSHIGHVWLRFHSLDMGSRALGFAALGFLTLVPLLIVVSAADPEHGHGFAQWLADGLGLSGLARKEVEELFAPADQALRGTTAFGLATLAVFGATFGGAVQAGYEKVWDLPRGRWYATWRHVMWLSVLVGYLFLSAVAGLWRGSSPGVAAASASAVLFIWWSERVLLGGRIAWLALLPGAVATVIGLIGLRVFSRLVFSPMIASNSGLYGPIGTVLIIQSWLVGVGVVVFGGSLVGRRISEHVPHIADRLPGRG